MAFLMKATPFFSKDRVACEARQLLLSATKTFSFINMAQLRCENLFPAVVSYSRNNRAERKPTTGPTLVFSGRLGPAREGEAVTFVNVPWLQNFKRHGVFELAPEMFKPFPVERLRSNPVLFKAAMHGNARKFAVIERLRPVSSSRAPRCLVSLAQGEDGTRSQASRRRSKRRKQDGWAGLC